ncbi:MAG TPA: hypothetical protein DHU56_02830 [Marinobacter sp.]|uniref:alpha/beta fold hydrolase n=1 Tax=Marinobacter sp. TaxID=50741 RepID=UPI000EE6D199|nr:alpha/beta fold hydrolase [Marinobacter sp.]MBC7193016.1 alpha/beta fold hydrolase [Marinobacter sp.]HCW88983.1 hypothetical protein [Marinobacter sp.]
MFKKTLISLAVASSLGLTGCFDSGGKGGNANPDYPISNPGVDGRAYPQFNPITGNLPVPTDLQFQQADPTANPPIASDGTYSDPAGLNPSAAEVTLGYLDGASTIAPIDIPFEGSIKEGSVDSTQFLGNGNPNPEQNVFLLELSYPGGDPLQSVSFFVHKDANINDGISNNELTPIEADAKINPATGLPRTKSVEIPVPAISTGASPVEFRHEVLSLNGGKDNYLRITPIAPLKPETRYLVVITDSILDSGGQPIIKDPLYKSVADPQAVLGNASALAPVRDAALGWQSLAEAYFNAATNQVRSALGMDLLTRDNVAVSFTTTTGGTSTVLDSIANPASFFAKNLTKEARQNGIQKLVTGQYTLDAMEVGTGYPNSTVAPENQCVNSALVGQLTDSSQDPYIAEIDPASESYDASIKTFADLPTNTAKAIAQQTVAGVNLLAQDGGLDLGGEACGDNQPGTIAQVAAGTVAQIPSELLPTPESRNSAFYTAGSEPLLSTDLNPQLPNVTDIHLGKIELPYYLKVPGENPAEDLATPWQASEPLGAALDQAAGNDEGTTPPTDRITYRYPFPGGETVVSAPVILQTPQGSGTKGGGEKLPVVIYQHGIFGERGHSIQLGNQLAAQGFAVIALDLPLHGVAPLTAQGEPNPLLGLSVDYDPQGPGQQPAFRQLSEFADLQERHFGYATDESQRVVEIKYGENAQGSSGANFLNLASLQTTRDAMRQAVVDLMNLNASIGSIDFDGDSQPDLDPSQVHFVGHSLGGIIGATFVATNNKAVNSGVSSLNLIQEAALVTPGSGFARLLENSRDIAPQILPPLARQGAAQGTSDLERFLTIAQAAVDSADSVNYASTLVELGTPVYVNEIYGDGSDRSTQDSTFPVAADKAYAGDYTAPLGQALPAPLSGTEPLISLLEAAAQSSTGATGGNVAVRFSTGKHTTVIRAESDSEKAVFQEMATNIASWFVQNGGALSFAGQPVVVTGDPIAGE